MRITASWSGLRTHRIQGCGTSIRAPHAAPLGLRHPTTASVLPCSEASRYDLALRERVATLARRPTLTAPARDSVWDLWVGAKKRASDRTKKLTKKKDNCRQRALDNKSPIQGFSDAEMLGSPHSRTVGVGEAPRHEVAAIGALGYNGRYGDLIGAQALIVGSRSPRTRFRHASGLEGLRDRGGGNLHSGDLRRRSGAFGQVGSVPAQDQRIGPSKLRAGSRVCLMTCRS